MKTPKITEEQLITLSNSDHLKAKQTMQAVIGACYLNLMLNEQGVYDKNFTTMKDEDYVEYVALLERIHKVK